MIYVEEFNLNFLVKEDLSNYVILRDDSNQYRFLDRDYMIYDYDDLQEIVAPKALAWWSDD